jgi:hypothetical protein
MYDIFEKKNLMIYYFPRHTRDQLSLKPFFMLNHEDFYPIFRNFLNNSWLKKKQELTGEDLDIDYNLNYCSETSKLEFESLMINQLYKTSSNFYPKNLGGILTGFYLDSFKFQLRWAMITIVL